MKLSILALLPLPLFAAVDGTVVNGTTGKPQANVMISLVQPGQGGMQTLGSTKTDAEGKFRIDKSAEGAQLLQAIHAGVPYNKMLSPGSPTTGVQVDVFDATKDAQSAKLSQHIVFLQPASDQLTVNEVYFVKNDTKTTYNNPADGSLQFYVPGHSAQGDSVKVSISAPGGMPVNRPAEATNKPGVYKVNFPVKPGETEFNVSYTLPSTAEFASKNVQKAAETKIVVPAGVTLEGSGVTALGNDPSGKAALYSATGQEYSVKISGTAASSSGSGGEGSQDDDTGQPQLKQVDPRIYAQLPVVLALAGVILLLGFLVLFRSKKGKPQ